MSSDEQLRYPIGKFSPKDDYSTEELTQFIARIESAPQKIEDLAKTIPSSKLDTPYREGGWTARQVLHHLADSHMNAYIRLKWTLTEETPLIKAYDEKAWAETAEVVLDPVMSINLLKALHVRWVELLKRVKPEEMKKSFVHPETGKHVTLARQLATYAWHGEHHMGHLKIILTK
jgi:hypothetical protein